MSSPETFDVVEQTLVGNWMATPLVFENTDWQLPDEPAHFVYVEVFGDFYEQASIGAESRNENLWREGGQLYLHVMTKNGIGSSLARQYGKQLAGLFRGEDIDGVHFLDGSIGAGEPGRSFPNYWAMTVTINWERDE